jgi:hypothetical protein
MREQSLKVPSAPKVSIVILNWNQEGDTAECLESLKAIIYPNYEVILVDNGSVDGSDVNLKERFPYITLLKNEENLGFAEGSNVGIRYALKNGADYVLLLNNDTIVAENLLSELVKIAESDPKIGVVGAVNYYYDEPAKIWASGAQMISWWTGKRVDITHNQVDIGQFEANREVDYVPGSCLMIKASVVQEVGLMEPKYFSYYEETDWCYRVKRYGYKVIASLSAKVWHKVSQAAGKNAKCGVELVNYLYNRNIFLFLWRNSPSKCLTTSIPINLCRILIQYFKLYLKGDRLNAFLLRCALLDAFLNRYGSGSLDKILSRAESKPE